MSYQPPDARHFQQPPVVAGYSPQPPPGDWTPAPAKKRSPLPWLIGVLVVLLIGLGGLVTVLLKNSGTASAPLARAASSTRAAAPEKYDTAQRLVGDLNKVGIACLRFEHTPNPVNAVDLGSCYVLSNQVVVAIFANHDDAAGDPASKTALLAGASDVNEVVGGNWTLSCDSVDLCKRIEHDFGGTYTHIPAASTAPAVSTAVPKPSDFKLTAKITDKQCFGSAGCNVTFRVDAGYSGTATLDPNTTWLVVYEINGVEDAPQVGNLTVTGTSVESTEEDVSTASTKSKITLKVTSVDKN